MCGGACGGRCSSRPPRVRRLGSVGPGHDRPVDFVRDVGRAVGVPGDYADGPELVVDEVQTNSVAVHGARAIVCVDHQRDEADGEWAGRYGDVEVFERDAPVREPSPLEMGLSEVVTVVDQYALDRFVVPGVDERQSADCHLLVGGPDPQGSGVGLCARHQHGVGRQAGDVLSDEDLPRGRRDGHGLHLFFEGGGVTRAVSAVAVCWAQPARRFENSIWMVNKVSSGLCLVVETVLGYAFF